MYNRFIKRQAFLAYRKPAKIKSIERIENMMKKRLLSVILALSLAAVCFTGCGGSENTDSDNETSGVSASDNVETDVNSDEESEEGDDGSLKAPVADGPIDLSEGATENMLIRSVLNEGDTSRLAEKLKNAVDNPEEMTNICFLGDSITAGSNPTESKNAYVKQFQTWWEDNISYFVSVTNAGIGATDSYLAVHRVETDVFAAEPDIIFIEFINDSNDEFYKTTMESLIRRCLSLENNPAVILIEMTVESGSSPQEVHSEVAKYYDVPVISYKDAIYPEVEAGNIDWYDFSADDTHPADLGHILVAELLENFCQNLIDNLENIETTSTAFDSSLEPLTSYKYENAALCDRSSELVTVTDEGSFTETTSVLWNFTNGWRTSDGGEITFELEFKNLGMLYSKTVDGSSGIAKITIDGVEISEINADFTNGWGDYACNTEIVALDETAVHTVTVSVSEGKSFEILDWMIS